MHISQTLAFVGYRAIADALGKAAFFVVLILAARRLSPSAFGLVALGTTLGWIAAVISDFGIGTHLARETARHPSARRCLLRAWLTVRLKVGAVVLAAAGLLLLTPLAPPNAAALALFILVYAIGGTLESLGGYFRGLSRADLESSLGLLQRAGQLLGASLVLAWRPDVALLALALLVPAVVSLLVGIRFAWRLAPRTSNEERRTSNEERRTENAERRTISVFLTDVAPIGVGIILSALYFRLDVLLLEWWQGLEAVAQYNAVFRLIEGLRLFPAAVLAVMLPSLVHAATRRPVTRLAAGLTVLSALAAVMLAAGADWLVATAYGPAYAAAVPAFRVLLIAFPLMSLNYALTTQLVAWNGQRAFAALCALALAFNLIVNARLIPTLSILGAAWTTVATEAVVTIGCLAALAARTAAARTAPGAAVLES